MDILNTKIKNILQEKTTKVRPENIKKDVTIFNITGTYEGAANTNNAKFIAKTDTYYNIFQFIQSIDDNYDISQTTALRAGFSNFSSLVKAPTLSTSHITDAQTVFSGCESLVDVPVYDWSGLTAHRNYNMFLNCNSLSNDSLNNILESCIGMTGVDTKTLKYIGLSSTQATACQSLSNWAAASAAGWSTGY